MSGPCSCFPFNKSSSDLTTKGKERSSGAFNLLSAVLARVDGYAALTHREAAVTGRSAQTYAAAVAFAMVLAVGGCGEDEPDRKRRSVADSSRSVEGIPQDGPAAAYVDWVDALARQDAAAACALQAPELTIALRYDAILADRAELGDPCVGFEALLWEDPEFDGEIVDIEVTQETEEDALLDVDHPSRDLTVRVVYHRARWRVFSTSDRAGRETGPARWLRAWCSLSPQDGREEIIALMGPPSGEYTVADGGEPQLWWAQDQYDFRVYLDVDGSVLELVGDYDALSEEDRALLPCAELRASTS
jgi:hypothetical protein